jgi:hypothetical protein
MKELPIVVRDDMVRALLDGRKTQMRHIIKPQPQHGVGRYTEDGTPGEVDWVLLDEDAVRAVEAREKKKDGKLC